MRPADDGRGDQEFRRGVPSPDPYNCAEYRRKAGTWETDMTTIVGFEPTQADSGCHFSFPKTVPWIARSSQNIWVFA